MASSSPLAKCRPTQPQAAVDYFNLTTRHGEPQSPASDLAADLCQNFHIANSPTPRRSLKYEYELRLPSNRSIFSLASTHASSNTTTATTPDSILEITSSDASSPTFDQMEISPLPHKAVYKSFQQNQGPLRPVSTNKMVLPRPSILRNKAASLASISRPIFHKSYSTFATIPEKASLTSLKDIFNHPGSPSPLNKPGRTNSLDITPDRLIKESPCMALQKSVAGPDRKRFRRTQSMVQSNAQFLGAQIPIHNTCNSPSEDGEGSTSLLPCFSVQSDKIKRIEKSTLCTLLDGGFSIGQDGFLIVDCRFPYEFEGGHIDGAVNVNTKDALEELLLKESQMKRRVIIFHCEYSAQRAPRMALHLRNADRHTNIHRYPYLHYPEIYILEGGYSSFFSSHRARCEPQSYIEMKHGSFAKDCARSMHQFKKSTRFLRSAHYSLSSSSPCGTQSPSLSKFGVADIRANVSPSMAAPRPTFFQKLMRH